MYKSSALSEKPWTDLDLFGGEVLGAPEDVALGDPLTAELMNLNHASECDEAHQRVGR